MSFTHLYCGAWNFKGEASGIKAFCTDNTHSVNPLGIYGDDLVSQSILAIAGDKIVAVSEMGNAGKVASYQITKNGALERKDVLDVNGTKLSYVVAAPNGKYVFTSSMGDGTVRMIHLGDDGKLTLKDEYRPTGHSVTARQSVAKTHSVMISPDGKMLAAANLGADEVDLFRVDYEKERLWLQSSAPIDFAKEPRHMAFCPDGKYLYVLTESGARLYVFRVLEWSLQEVACYKALDTKAPQTGGCADVVVSPDGRFVYSTNVGQSNIAVWRVLNTGLLDLVGHCPCGGTGPRGLNISADGEHLFCANNGDGTVAIMLRDAESGTLSEAVVVLQVPSAGCVRSI